MKIQLAIGPGAGLIDDGHMVRRMRNVAVRHLVKARRKRRGNLVGIDRFRHLSHRRRAEPDHALCGIPAGLPSYSSFLELVNRYSSSTPRMASENIYPEPFAAVYRDAYSEYQCGSK